MDGALITDWLIGLRSLVNWLPQYQKMLGWSKATTIESFNFTMQCCWLWLCLSSVWSYTDTVLCFGPSARALALHKQPPHYLKLCAVFSVHLAPLVISITNRQLSPPSLSLSTLLLLLCDSTVARSQGECLTVELAWHSLHSIATLPLMPAAYHPFCRKAFNLYFQLSWTTLAEPFHEQLSNLLIDLFTSTTYICPHIYISA